MNKYNSLESKFESACGLGEIAEAAGLAAELAAVARREFLPLAGHWERRAADLRIQAAALPN